MTNRRSIRLSDYDYTSAGAYFATLVTQDRRSLFGGIIDDAMRLNALGQAVMDEWLATPAHRPYVELDEFVVMPNHVHAVVWILYADDRAPHGGPLPAARRYHASDSGSLSAILRAFKSATTRRINVLRRTPGTPLWQRNYFERVIRNDRELHDIRRYIVDNPARWSLDHENPERATVPE